MSHGLTHMKTHERFSHTPTHTHLFSPSTIFSLHAEQCARSAPLASANTRIHKLTHTRAHAHSTRASSPSLNCQLRAHTHTVKDNTHTQAPDLAQLDLLLARRAVRAVRARVLHLVRHGAGLAVLAVVLRGVFLRVCVFVLSMRGFGVELYMCHFAQCMYVLSNTIPFAVVWCGCAKTERCGMRCQRAGGALVSKGRVIGVSRLPTVRPEC